HMLTSLEGQVGHVTVSAEGAPPDAHVRLGTRDLPAAALGVPLPVMPGHTVVEIQAPGFEPARGETDVAAGGTASVELHLGRLPLGGLLLLLAPSSHVRVSASTTSVSVGGVF